MKTLDEQIEYMHQELKYWKGVYAHERVDLCEPILKTLEESRWATDVALERAAEVSDGYVGCGAISNKIRALKSKP